MVKTDSILSIRNLSKEYRTHWLYQKRCALKSVSFDLYKGETLALLGLNGAGKTTTIKCILGLVNINSGDISLEGSPLVDAKQRSEFGFLPEQPYFYQHLNVEETLFFYGNMLGLAGEENKNQVNKVLNLTALNSRRKDKIRSLSKGLQQRVGIAQAILNDPKILILDEPFSGLDPVARRDMKDIFVGLKEKGASIIVSSHILHDIELFADRAIFLSRGEIIKERGLKLNESISSAFRIELNHELGISESLLNDFLNEFSISCSKVEVKNDLASIIVTSRDQADICIHMAMHKGYKIHSFNLEYESLEETFLGLDKQENHA